MQPDEFNGTIAGPLPIHAERFTAISMMSLTNKYDKRAIG